MKLFQRLLVAPAALGLLAPVAANASEVNLNDISNYSDVENIELTNSFNDQLTEPTLLAGGEGLGGYSELDDSSYDGGFSSTTSASFSVDMAIGATEGNQSPTEALAAVYGYQIDLSTSFTGEDSLDVAIDAGSGQSSLAELDLNTTQDVLTVDGVTYTFPIGDKLTVLVGDSTSGSALYSTACVYGGFTNTLDDCGNFGSAFTATGHTTSGGNGTVGFSAAYDIGNGFTGAIGYNGEGSDNNGLGTQEGLDFYGGQLTYTAENYGASITYANLDAATGWGLNGYYTFASNLPSVSVGYEFGEVDPVGAVAGFDTTQWFVGFQWDELGNGTLGVAMGSRGPQVENAEEDMAYEIFYTYNVNDSMTITPALFILEDNDPGDDDTTGVVVKTSFSF